jgi:hypothetical protein
VTHPRQESDPRAQAAGASHRNAPKGAGVTQWDLSRRRPPLDRGGIMAHGLFLRAAGRHGGTTQKASSMSDRICRVLLVKKHPLARNHLLGTV